MRGADVSDSTVCLAHIEDDALRRELAGWISWESCSFCDRLGSEEHPIAVELDVVVDQVMSAIREDYQSIAESGLPLDDDTIALPPSSYSEELVEELAYGAIDDDVVQALVSLVGPEEWIEEDWGWERRDHALRRGWDSFKDLVKHTSRFVFLSTTPATSLAPDEFTPREILEAVGKVIGDLELIDILPAGTAVHRGRMQEDASPAAFTASSLGSPPLHKAAANRMSPAGISMFYGSTSSATALAEIAAHDDRQWGTVGEFETLRDLRVVDYTKKVLDPSIFDAQRRRHRFSIRFLREFIDDITKSIELEGSEHVEYVPTQVLTEYLRWLGDIDINGFVLPSAQSAGGKNIVLFVGPEGCADPGSETTETVLLYRPGRDVTLPRP